RESYPQHAAYHVDEPQYDREYTHEATSGRGGNLALGRRRGRGHRVLADRLAERLHHHLVVRRGLLGQHRVAHHELERVLREPNVHLRLGHRRLEVDQSLHRGVLLVDRPPVSRVHLVGHALERRLHGRGVGGRRHRQRDRVPRVIGPRDLL